MNRLRNWCRLGPIPIRVLPALILAAARVDAADHLNTLGSPPPRGVLEHYQQTITRDEFTNLLQNVYCTQGIPSNMINVGDDSANILMNRESKASFTLRFAPDQQSQKRVPRLWRTPEELKQKSENKPLLGLRVALDPGHIGGKWAKMEERWFKIGESEPVQEGNLTLRVARILADRLRRLGATVSFVRNNLEPVTPKRPDDFREFAKQVLIRNGVPEPRATPLNQDDPEKEHTIRWQSEMLFYRYSEIRRRAVLVNTKLHPDLVVCLHLNAEGWGDPSNPTMIPANH